MKILIQFSSPAFHILLLHSKTKNSSGNTVYCLVQIAYDTVALYLILNDSAYSFVIQHACVLERNTQRILTC